MEFSEILSRHRYTTELHAHTFPVSACADFTPVQTVGFYKKAGVNSLTLTNHLNPNWVEGNPALRAKEYLSDYYRAQDAAGGDLNIILAVEIRFTENSNDYLVYGVDEDQISEFIKLIPYGIRNFYKEAKTERNLIIQAHPFRKNIVLAPLDCIDGIETLNMHPGHNSKNGIAMQVAKENNLIVSGGTDFHHEGHEALCLMRSEEEVTDSFQLAQTLKSRSAIFDCSGHIVLPYLY